MCLPEVHQWLEFVLEVLVEVSRGLSGRGKKFLCLGNRGRGRERWEEKGRRKREEKLTRGWGSKEGGGSEREREEEGWRRGKDRKRKGRERSNSTLDY